MRQMSMATGVEIIEWSMRVMEVMMSLKCSPNLHPKRSRNWPENPANKMHYVYLMSAIRTINETSG